MTVAQKFVAAAKAQREWATTSRATRASILRRYAALLRENANVLAGDITTEKGKPITQAKAEGLAAAKRVETVVDSGKHIIATGENQNDNAAKPAGHCTLGHEVKQRSGPAWSEVTTVQAFSNWAIRRQLRVLAGFSHKLVSL